MTDIPQRLKNLADDLERRGFTTGVQDCRKAAKVIAALEDYNHHLVQSGFDYRDGLYDDSAEEKEIADEALQQAIILCRGCTSGTEQTRGAKGE
jgi:hypothetical protein